MKTTIKILSLVLLCTVLVLGQSLVAQQNNPNFKFGGGFYSWFDTSSLISFSGSESDFSLNGGTILNGDWHVIGTFYVDTTILLDGRVSADVSTLTSELLNVSFIETYISFQDSTGRYYFIGDEKRVPLDGTWTSIVWDLKKVKDSGIKSINRFSLEFMVHSSIDSGANVKAKMRTKNIQFSDLATGIISVVPKTFSLSQNYPNPFNPTTKIQYSISKSSYVTLKVYNILGKEIATLVNEEKNIGHYEVNFSGLGLPSGMYVYKISAGNFSDTRKMVLLK